MTRILLMAAGAGSRFGSGTPKPFIRVNGLPMWHHVGAKAGLKRAADGSPMAVSLVTRSDHQHYIASTDHQGYSPVVDNIKAIRPMVEQGPAWSVVAATLGGYTEDIIVMDSDCYLSAPDAIQCAKELTHFRQIELFRPNITSSAAVFALRTMKDDQAAMAVMESNKGPMIASVPGVRRGELLNIGTYWFRSVSTFQHAVANMPFFADGTKELKVADVFNYLKHREVYEVVGNFHNLGTPEQLEDYKEVQGYGTTE